MSSAFQQFEDLGICLTTNTKTDIEFLAASIAWRDKRTHALHHPRANLDSTVHGFAGWLKKLGD